ncbi:hypothetical protein MA16_Dca024742 [Dendrobium catenatum]|uniref:RNase H type-1 domain-containing protein n=1 Tax=Dendrobium catenatum TaxID=906689 RepID=A0A2I0XFX4_9ASPA|nr:hypothetical protein MA16_Dca024742 [Dendrobium catenatum]
MEISADHNGMILNLFFNVLFFSWKARNKLTHDKVLEGAISVAANAVSYSSISKLIIKINSNQWNVNQPPMLSKNWHPPPPEWLKINVDASLDESYKAGIGGVICDSKGRFFMAFGMKYIHWDVFHLELQAIKSLKEIIKDWMFKYKGAFIEGDNANVIRRLQKARINGFKGEVDFDFLSEFNLVIFSYVERSRNKLADWCAKYASSNNFIWEELCLNKIPPSVVEILKEESTL